jgi:exonuclease III
MDLNRSWKILNWNLRGINSEKKWLALSSKIVESGCDIICLQETKRESFDLDYIKKFCPRKFNNLNFFPQLVLLEVLLLFGMEICSKGI